MNLYASVHIGAVVEVVGLAVVGLAVVRSLCGLTHHIASGENQSYHLNRPQ